MSGGVPVMYDKMETSKKRERKYFQTDEWEMNSLPLNFEQVYTQRLNFYCDYTYILITIIITSSIMTNSSTGVIIRQQ